MNSIRNKTIKTSVEEGDIYLKKCLKLDKIKSFEDTLNKTINGDFFDVIKKIPNNSIDLIIADPMYNIDRDFDKVKFKKMKKYEYENYTKNWLSECKRVLKDNGSIYIYCDWITGITISNLLNDYFILRNRITWQREKGKGSKKNWKNSMEDIYFCTKSNEYKFNLDNVKIKKRVIAPYRNENNESKDWYIDEGGVRYRYTSPSNFWDDITIPFWSMPENTGHPTQKSEKLIAKIILASSDKNDIILDPFLGSGTTSVVAKKLGRKYIGIEINEQYCIWSEQRLEMADKINSIQGYENGIFFDRKYK